MLKPNNTQRQKQTIQELIKQNNRLNIINQIAQSINIKMSYEEIIEQVAAPLRQVISYDLLSFCLLENNQLIIKSGIPKEQKILGVGTLLGEKSAPWLVTKMKKCYLRQDIWHDTKQYQEDASLRQVGIKSAVMAPMLINNQAIGTFNLGSNRAFAYSENDFLFVQHLADQLAVCIDNNRLYHETLQIKRVWEETFKAVPDVLFVMDKHHQIMRINHGIEDQSAEQIVGRKCYEIFNYCGQDLSTCPAQKALQTGQHAFKEITHPETKRTITINAYPVYDPQEGLARVVVYTADVTSKRRLETQLFQSAKLAAVGEMAAGVAHELNSPLTAVIGNAELLLRNLTLTEKPLKLLTDIRACGQRCRGIIQNLLLFSRQDSATFEQLQINHVIESSLSLVHYQMEKSRIQIKKHLTVGLPPIMGNFQQLEQIIVNFLLNARDALEDCTTKQVTIYSSFRKTNGIATGLEVTVTDTGIGIEQNHLEQIFNPFFTTKERLKGTGLGLSVSLGIAESHGGTIEVGCKIGGGSSFTLVLPF